MLRAPVVALLMLLVGCRTTTVAAPPPQALWEVPLDLTEDGRPVVKAKVGALRVVRLLVDTGAAETTVQGSVEGGLLVGGEQVPARAVDFDPAQQRAGLDGTLAPHRLVKTGAVVLDLPGKRLLVLGGLENNWLRWLDERSPKGELAGVARMPPADGGLLVQTRVGDGPEVLTRLSTSTHRSAYARTLFDPALLTTGNDVRGVHLKIRDAEFGPLDLALLPGGEGVEGVLGLDLLKDLVVLVPVHASPRIWFMTPRE